MTDARKLQEVPFPFPFEQCVAVMMLFATVVFPFHSGVYASRAAVAFFAPFIVIFFYWSVYYTGTELEMPFRDSPNGLDITEHQRDMTRSLCVLLNSNASHLPACAHSPRVAVSSISLSRMRLRPSLVSASCSNVEDIPSIESADAVQQDFGVEKHWYRHVGDAQQQIRDAKFANKLATRPIVYAAAISGLAAEFNEPVLPADPVAQVTCRTADESSLLSRSSREDLGLHPMTQSTLGPLSAHHHTETSVSGNPSPEVLLGSLRALLPTQL